MTQDNFETKFLELRKLSGEVIHHTRAPITSVCGYLQLLLRIEENLSESSKEILEKALLNAEKVKHHLEIFQKQSSKL